MANGYFERGEIYNIRMDNGIGSEEGSYRPGVIISNSKVNSSFGGVIIAYCTSRFTRVDCTMKTLCTGRDTYIMCNQLATVDKSRLKPNPLGELAPAELKKLDDILEEVFDLGYADDGKDAEIEKLKAEIAELTGEVAREQAKAIELTAKHEDELLSYKVENAMWQKCYERSLDQLVKMKVTADVAVRAGMAPKTPKVPEIKPPVEENHGENPPSEEPVEDERLDINTASATALKKAGFSVALAKAVAKARPFTSVEDLKKVPGMAKTKYQILAPKLCCVPVAPEEQDTTEKLNINALSANDLVEKLGIAKSTSYCIVAYRREHGPFTKLEDMLDAKQVFPGTVDKIRDKVFCGPGIEEKPVVGNRVSYEKPAPDLSKYAGNKVNINLATAKEINEKTGLSLTICYSIVGCRKRDGNYRAVEDLENVPRFTEYHMKHYAPMFEV